MTHQAAFDFDAVNHEELSVKTGELLTVSGPPVDGWLKCRSVTTGKEGFVPESYVKAAAAGSAAPRRSAPKAPGGAAPNAFETSFAAVSLQPTPSYPPPAAAMPQTGYGAQPTGTLAYTAPPPAFAPPPALGKQPQSSSNPNINLTKRGGGYSEIDRRSIPYEQNLSEWRERERKFKKGEQERLPPVKERQYYYWDKNSQRQGPFTEAEMKARFDQRQVGSDTQIAPITTEKATEALPKMSVNEYFPNVAQSFITAPIAPIENHTWLYLDDSGQVQGPFDAAQMRDWFLDQYFNADTKAKLASRQDIGFVPLSVLFGADGADAFLSDGDQRAASQHPQSWPAPPAAARSAVPPAFAPPPAYADPFGVSASTFAVPPAFGSNYSDPFGLPPPAPTSQSNPFASPARSPSSGKLGLTPKAQSGRMLLSMAINGTPATTNPFEAPDYQTPMKLDQSEDDWGISWDDEKEEAGNQSQNKSDIPMPVPVSDGKEADNRNLAPFERIRAEYLATHDSLYRFLTRALPKELGTVRCKIRRSIVGMMHVNYNQYELFLEKDDGSLGPQILEAVKHKRMGFDNYFNIQIGSASPAHGGTTIAELVMTTLGSQFLLHNNVKSHQGRARDLAYVHYLRTGSGGGPRRMTVAIPGFASGSESEFVEWSHGGSIKKSNLVTEVESLRFKNIQPLINKPPVWSEKCHAWTLNFHGRVTRASVKNFQLVRPEDHDHVVLQHGRVGQDTFTMDVAWPLSPVQAFAVALSSLHAKMGVE